MEFNSRILIQCGDLVENKTRILPLAESLRMLGHRPMILHYNPSAFSFFSSRGFDCASLNKYRSKVSKRDVNRSSLAPAFFDDQSYPIFKTKHDLERSKPADLLRDLFMLRRDGVALTRLLCNEDVDSIIVWNGVTGHVANALRVIGREQARLGGFLERGYLRNSVFFDRLGTNGASSISRGIATIYERSLVEESVASVGDFVREKIILADAPPRKDSSKIVFVPLQVQLDSNILLYSQKIKTMRQMVFAAIDLARRLGSDWKVVVRDHPEEGQSALNIPFDERVVRDNVSSLEDVLDAAAVVCTVNSTVGMTAAFKGKVVVCSGSGIYCNEGFVINGSTMGVDEIADRVMSSLDRPPRWQEIIEFASVLLHRHHIYKDELGLSPVFGKTLKSYGNTTAKFAGATLLQQIKERLAEASRLNADGIALDIRLTFGETVPLTYRTTERVSKRWISDALATNFPDAKFRKVGQANEDGVGRAGTVCILPADGPLSKELADYLAVLDEFGMPHHGFYGGRYDGPRRWN